MRMEKWGNGLIERLRFVTHNVLSYVCLCYLCLLSLLDKQKTNSLSTDTFVNLYFLAALKLLVSYFEVYCLECILIKSSSFFDISLPLANFGPLSRGQSHLSDVNHSVLLLIFDPIVTGSFVARLSHQTQKESNLFKYSLIGQFVDWSFLLKVLDFALTMKTFARSETNEFFDIIRYFL